MRRTILIVEDTDVCRDSLELALMRLPEVDIRVVATAEEALKHLTTGNVCALVTDLNLPSMNGFALIEAVRSSPGSAALPILVISGDSDPGTPSRLRNLGASAYFAKPYSPTEVRTTLERLIDAS